MVAAQFARIGPIAADRPRLAQANAEALIRDHGGGAYSEARQREREPNQPTAARNSRPGNSTNSIITSVMKAASKTIKMSHLQKD